MYQHHEESLKILEDMFRGREEVIALVFGGSVAKGMERPDSDLDAMVIVTQEYFDQCMKENRTAECLSGCTYEGGYFDIKYMTKDFQEQAALMGVSLRGIRLLSRGCFFRGIRKLRRLWRLFLFFRRRRGRRSCFRFSVIWS